MKTTNQFKTPFYVIASLMIGFASCKKESTETPATDEPTADFIGVAASSTTTTSTSASPDSVYMVQPCGPENHREAVAEANLSASITTYLTTSYPGYVFHKAFAVKNKSGVTAGFAVVIYYNQKAVGLAFDKAGNFVKVLEQREKSDLHGTTGWHFGGRFSDRDGKLKDTIALVSLSSTVHLYMTANYPTDTLVRAYLNKDGGIVVITRNNGAFATAFNASFQFIKRVQLHSKEGVCHSITQSALQAAILTYLDTTYPNYVFKNAFSITLNSTVKGYVVLLDANNTKYAVEFDASGNFYRAKTII
jgi:hypothetical protein